MSSNPPLHPDRASVIRAKNLNDQNLLILRQGLLAQVDAIERILEMPTTADMRHWAKERGFYEGLAQDQ
jgi:hypothetical protein